MNPIIHFEIPFDDKEKVMKFYSEVFGWKLNDMPDMKYVIAHTGETDEKTFMLKKPGMINGGMYKRDEKSAQSPVLVIDVPNLDAHIKKVKASGGKIFRGKMQVGDMGFYAQVQDTEGNIIGLWEMIPKKN